MIGTVGGSGKRVSGAPAVDHARAILRSCLGELDSSSVWELPRNERCKLSQARAALIGRLTHEAPDLGVDIVGGEADMVESFAVLS
jgi:hypothetical protein